MIRQYTTAICLLLLGVFMISCASPSEITRSEPKDTPEILDGNSNVTPLRNMPQQVKLPSSFLQAVQNKTRTLNGKPGPNYWTNTTLYDISVELFPDDTLLVGSANITYFNNSPDTLPAVVLELAQNLHQVNAIRKERVEITGGIQIRSVSVDEEKMTPINDFVPGYQVDGTNMIVVLPNEVAPKHSVSLKIEWAFKIPQAGASERMGYSYGNLYHIAYWYPKMSVYDDLEGWFLDEFTGNSEFYHGFGDYDLEITIPREWLVMGTGELINAKDILIPEVYEKYEAAFKTDSTYRIVDAENAQNATNRTASGKHTWKFRAKNVRDVAFSAVSQSNWDGTRALVGDIDGDGINDYSRIHSFWRKRAPEWKKSAEFAKHSIEFLSKYTGLGYPWPHMTSVEGDGIISGGMEFPMITLIGGDYLKNNTTALYDVTAHELAHMWLPMIVSNNERRAAWMDEGSTTFHEAHARWDKFPNSFSHTPEFNFYLSVAGTENEGEIMRRSDYHYPGPAYGVASYPKPAIALLMLKLILGNELFESAWKEFIKDWAYKHPTPYDLFNTFERVANRDLDWFWHSWYFETWVYDHGVQGVVQENGKVQIGIYDHGDIPMPIMLQIIYRGGESQEFRKEADVWLAGKRLYILEFETNKEVISVHIDHEYLLPDKNRSNNIWRIRDFIK